MGPGIVPFYPPPGDPTGFGGRRRPGVSGRSLGIPPGSSGYGFKAVDTGQGEFESGLPRHPVVESTDALTAVQVFRPDLVVYAWPPPGQSIGPLGLSPGVCYVLVLGEPNGGCTGDPGDWQRFRYRYANLLSRYGLGRSGRRRQAATVFFGAASPYFREEPVKAAQAGKPGPPRY